MANIEQIADQLWHASVKGQMVPSVALANSDLSLEDAYGVLERMIARREAAGAVRVGRKLGVTAAGGMQNFGITEPVHGVLFANGAVPNGGAVAIGGQVVQPKIESEIGFVMARDVNEILGEDALIDAIEAVVPCYEIAGSRIDGWPKKIQDLVADSCGFCAYVLGEGRVKPGDIDLANMKVSVSKNGEAFAQGTGAECMGSPLNALTWLVEKLVAKGQGQGLKAGDLVLTGALGGMIPAEPGDQFSTQFEGVGSVSVQFV